MLEGVAGGARRPPSRRRASSLRCPAWPLLGALGVLLASGCETTQRVFWDTGLPWTRSDFEVASAVGRGPYLDVKLEGGGITRRVLSLDDPVCRLVLEPGAQVTMKQGGSTGIAVRGDASCDLVGIGDLEDWRLSRAVGGYGNSPIVRSTTRVEIVGSDADYLYARGAFGISGWLKWSPGTDRVVALLPRGRPCAEVEAGFVDLLFQEAGRPALSIAVSDGRCPLEAVAAEVPGAFPAADEASPAP